MNCINLGISAEKRTVNHFLNYSISESYKRHNIFSIRRAIFPPYMFRIGSKRERTHFYY